MSKENIHTNPFCMDRLQISMIKLYKHLSATVMTLLSVRTGSEEGSYVINTFEAPNFPKMWYHQKGEKNLRRIHYTWAWLGILTHGCHNIWPQNLEVPERGSYIQKRIMMKRIQFINRTLFKQKYLPLWHSAQFDT